MEVILSIHYSEIYTALDSNLNNLFKIWELFNRLLSIDQSDPCVNQKQISQQITHIDIKLRELLYHILRDLETLGSLCVDTNIIDIIRKNMQSNDPKYTKFVLFAGNNHALRIANYYGAECTRNPPEVLNLQFQKLSSPITSLKRQMKNIEESDTIVEQNNRGGKKNEVKK